MVCLFYCCVCEFVVGLFCCLFVVGAMFVVVGLVRFLVAWSLLGFGYCWLGFAVICASDYLLWLLGLLVVAVGGWCFTVRFAVGVCDWFVLVINAVCCCCLLAVCFVLVDCILVACLMVLVCLCLVFVVYVLLFGCAS